MCADRTPPLTPTTSPYIFSNPYYTRVRCIFCVRKCVGFCEINFRIKCTTFLANRKMLSLIEVGGGTDGGGFIESALYQVAARARNGLVKSYCPVSFQPGWYANGLISKYCEMQGLEGGKFPTPPLCMRCVQATFKSGHARNASTVTCRTKMNRKITIIS